MWATIEAATVVVSMPVAHKVRSYNGIKAGTDTDLQLVNARNAID